MASIHNRMPVIVAEQDYDRWLDTHIAGANVTDAIQSFPAAQMEAYPISPAVNSPKNDGPELTAPIMDSPTSD
jgi:putative SOS response-associated peptidase YedK